MIDNLKSAALLEKALGKGVVFATAESCTGGLIAAMITEIPGSSNWFDRGFVTYTNQAKMDLLGVKEDTLKNYGAVSEQTVREMVAGALKRSRATVAVAVSGIAGPGGGTPDKPVGTVWVAFGIKNQAIKARCLHLNGSRSQIRKQVVDEALRGLLACIDGGFLLEYK